MTKPTKIEIDFRKSFKELHDLAEKTWPEPGPVLRALYTIGEDGMQTLHEMMAEPHPDGKPRGLRIRRALIDKAREVRGKVGAAWFILACASLNERYWALARHRANFPASGRELPAERMSDFHNEVIECVALEAWDRLEALLEREAEAHPDSLEDKWDFDLDEQAPVLQVIFNTGPFGVEVLASTTDLERAFSEEGISSTTLHSPGLHAAMPLPERVGARVRQIVAPPTEERSES